MVDLKVITAVTCDAEAMKGHRTGERGSLFVSPIIITDLPRVLGAVMSQGRGDGISLLCAVA